MPLVQQRQPVGVQAGEGEIVHRAHHGETVFVAQPIDQFEGLLLVPDVERTRRLVEQHDRRLLGERPRDHQPLPLTTAHRAQVPARQVGEIEAFEHVGHHRTIVVGLDAEVADVGRAPQQHVLGAGHVGRQLGALRHVRDQFGTASRRADRQRGTVDLDLTGVHHQPGRGTKDR